MSFSSSIFRGNDIRGIFNKEFDSHFCKDLAKGLFFLLREKKIKSPKILIGHDSRLSSALLAKTLALSLKEEGFSVCNIGLSPSPLCYFLLHHYNLTATVVVTASHNPVEYNGFKVMIHKKFKEFEPITKIKSFISKKASSKTISQGSFFSIDPLKPYLCSLKKEFSELKPRSFVVDTGNGALGPVLKKVFKELSLSPYFLFSEPDGRFPHHHPDPSVESHLEALKQKVFETKSSFGLGFDGDGDRITLLTKTGRFIYGDEFGSLFFNSLLEKSKRPILGDVKCSDWFFRSIEKKGGKPFKTPSGHLFIRKVLYEKKAQLAVDFSGHIFFNDRKERGFDDALYASLRLIELLNQTNLSSLLPREKFFGTKEVRIPMEPLRIQKILFQVKNHLEKKKEDYESFDGLRGSRRKSWFLFRGSKTQNALTYRLEAESLKDLEALKKEFSPLLGFKI